MAEVIQGLSCESFFEVDDNAIARSAAYALYQSDELSDQQLKDIYKACDHDPAKPHPWEV